MQTGICLLHKARNEKQYIAKIKFYYYENNQSYTIANGPDGSLSQSRQ